MAYKETTSEILHSDRILIENNETGETRLIRNQDILNRWYFLHISCINGCDEYSADDAYQLLEEAIRHHNGEDWSFVEAVAVGATVYEYSL
jgi:hypothetical protein